jgi:Uncharacterised nucleotidyltransferase
MTRSVRRRDGYFSLSSRHELLLRAALGGDARSVAAFHAWKQGLDVQRIDLASQRFVPRLVANLERLGTDLDDPVLEQFRKVARFTWLKTQFLIANCEPLVAALGAAGIPAMLLKGAAVVHHTGGEVALRPMDDIDIAVPLASLHAAFAVAAEVGFTQEGPARTREELEVCAALLHALGTRNDASALVDVHWHMIPDGLHPEADRDFWHAAEPALLGRAACSASSREDTMLHAVAHAARPETDPSLRWAADVAALVQSAPARGIDWDRLVRQARRHRVALQMAQALDVVRRVADVPVPAEVVRALGRSRVPLAERIDAGPRLRRDGGPRLPNQAELVADAYQRFVGRQVPPGRRPSPVDGARFLREWWDLGSLRAVPFHAAFVAAGRPWGITARARRPRPTDAPVLALGRTVGFAIGDGGGRYLGADWSFPEEQGTWTTGREATLHLRVEDLPPPESPLVARLGLAPILTPVRPHLEVDVAVNGQKVARWTFVGTTWSPQVVQVQIDPSLWQPSGVLEIRLVIHRPTTPNSMNAGSDSRPLGLCLRSLLVTGSDAVRVGSGADGNDLLMSAALHTDSS